MNIQISEELANIIVDPKAYSAGVPVDDAFSHIRRNSPLAQAQPTNYDPFWVVSRHADVLEIERRADVFHNADRSTLLLDRDAAAMVRTLSGGEQNLIRSLVSIDGDEHRALRAITFPSFTPQSVRKVEENVREIARDFVARLDGFGGECDFAKDFAFLYPLRVIMSVLGVPPEDEPRMLQLTQEIFSGNDPDLNRSGQPVTPTEAQEAFNQTMLDLEAYFGEVTRRFRANPQDNINSLIANARINEEYLTHRQMMGYYIIAATAGHDTTSNTIAAALWAVAERPELFDQLKNNPDLMDGFIEESIRWATPVKHFMRSAIEDTEVNGITIAKDDWLMLSYQSANRDESVFDRPFEFDATRKPSRHVAFGYGRHVCLGQHLARLEMRILWEELFSRLESIELAGKPQLTQSNFVCGPKSVPVRFVLS